MNDQVHTFASRFGTLQVHPDGVTIKRTWGQAMSNGRVARREQHIPYSAIKSVKNNRTGFNRGALQLTQKYGTPKVTPLNRNAVVKFDPRQAHQFRQAQRLIETKLREINGE